MAIEDDIASNPQAWPVIQGIRKARGARGASGKSGGVRVIYYVLTSADTIYLLSIYAKNGQEDLTDEQKRKLREFVATLG
jgi:hypothetical protein